MIHEFWTKWQLWPKNVTTQILQSLYYLISTLAATKNWWGLHPDEIVLITNHLLAEVPAVLKDTPVFLPVKSPTVSNFSLPLNDWVNGIHYED